MSLYTSIHVHDIISPFFSDSKEKVGCCSVIFIEVFMRCYAVDVGIKVNFLVHDSNYIELYLISW